VGKQPEQLFGPFWHATFATIMEYRVPFDVEAPLGDGGNIGRQGSLA